VAVLSFEERLRRIEGKLSLLVSIADCEKHPFICACLDAGMDGTQVDKILVLLTGVENSNGTGDSISYSQFDQEIKGIVPSKKDDAEFAKVLIRALNRENKFIIGTKKFKEEGVTI
jgi:hypothetical protein